VVSFMSDSSNDAIAEEDRWINEIADRFYKLEIRTDKLLLEKQKQQQHEQQKQQQQQPNKINKCAIKLEPMRFERFEGSLRLYPRFKYEFDTHISPLCSKEQLPIVLRSYLAPAVQEDVENIDKYDEMWLRLDEKYGDRQKLIDDILSDIASLDTTNSSSSSDESALDMIRIIERAHQDLVRLKEETELHNATILSKIEQRMPAQMFGEWIKEAVLLSNQQKYKRLIPFLQEWRKRIEYTSATIRNTRKENLSSNINDCWIHKCEHPIWECRVFQSMSVAERKKLAELNKACTSCLEIGHDIRNCRRNFVCPETNCSEKHNRLLHQ